MEDRHDSRGELLVTPSGRISASGTGRTSSPRASIRPVMRALESSQAEGLFTLAAKTSSGSLPPALAFWQDFARQYLTALCQTPESTDRRIDPVEPPTPEQLTKTLLNVPPMRGSEYLSVEALGAIWRDLDEWVRTQVKQASDGLAGFLKQHAPQWHQVGRVCFHLAENKRDKEYPFAFLATYIPGITGQDKARYQPLAKALQQYAGAKNKPALVRLLSPIQLASEKSSLIRSLVDSGDIFHPLAWSPQEALRFLKESPLYVESGVLVRLPDWWRKRSRAQVGVVIGQKRKARLGADSLLDFSVNVALGDQVLTDEEWRELQAGDDGLVLFKGRWVEVDRDKLAAALDHWRQVEEASSDGSMSFVEGMRLLAGASAEQTDAADDSSETAEWSFIRPGKWLGETLGRLRDPQADEGGKIVNGLHATLRPYQQTGVEWLWLLTNLGLGACLADDMGLGKTIQVLALLLLLKKKQGNSKPSLLVLPASLLANWKAEMDRFAPSLTAVFVHSSETDKASIERLAASPKKALRDIDVVLTTYGMLKRQSWLTEIDWRVVVLDEAQAIKNPAARQTRAVKTLHSQSRIALTGTPVENRLSDLWSLFDFLCPGLLGSAAKFKQFVKMMESREHKRYAPLRNLVSPYLLRRLKTDKTIITDLPEKSEVKAFCGLTKRQTVLYKKSVDELAKAMEGEGGIKRRGIILAFLMRFKQICNHPSQFLGDGEYRSADSGKFFRLTEICEEIASRQEKAIVFTQFREMTGPLQLLLSAVFQRPGLVLHGGTPVGKRKKLVDAFQREDGPPFFVLSLKAGGTGLNLTAASHVLHFDRWWNPAVENQATDRAFRIGQDRNVLVHKFVCRGTIEERIDQLIEDKKSLADDLLEAGAEKLLTEMNDQQLIDLVSLDVNKAML